MATGGNAARLPTDHPLFGTDVDADADMPYDFGFYKATFGRSYPEGSDEHKLRERIYSERVALIQAHNTGEHSWKMGVNHFTDRTEEEMQQQRGYRRTHASLTPGSLIDISDSSCSAHQQSCMDGKTDCCTGLTCGLQGFCEETKSLPEEIDWNTHLHTSVLDQGGCGSCWAVAATAVIQLQAAHVSNNSFTKALSPQGMLGCTPNPRNCGGDGGCGGATPELAFEWVKSHGVQYLDKQAYTASAECPSSFLEAKPAVQIGGFVRLPENKADRVMGALVIAGPLAVALAAGDLHSYGGGVFDGCHTKIVDHAVVLTGYGTYKSKAYWKVQNSWGPGWGEKGFFRLRRHAPLGEEPCGWDTDPKKGVGCDGGPKKLWVCGECGILSDVAYPIGTKVSSDFP